MRAEKNVLAAAFHAGSLLRFAAPTICMMVFTGLYTITDTVFVSRFAGTDALSALNICTPLLYAVVGLASMLATGASAIIGRKMGAQDMAGARQTLSFIVLCAVILSALIMAGGLCFRREILGLLGATDVLVPYGEGYLFVQFLFVPANILGVLFQTFLIVAGKPRTGFVLAVAGGLSNVILDALFLVHLDMGISGAALGTGIGYLFAAVGGVLFFARNKKGLYFCRPKIRWAELGHSLLNGSSELVTQLSSAVSTLFFNLIMLRIAGEPGVAAVTVIIYTQFLLQTLFLGFSMGVAPIFSYHYGGGNTEQMRRVFRICAVSIGVFSISTALFALLLGPAAARLFDPGGAEVYSLAAEGLRVFSVSFLFCGFNLFASSLFTALSNGKASAAISFLRTFGFLLLFLFLLPAKLGITGVWLAVPFAEGCTFFVALLLLFANRKRYGYF